MATVRDEINLALGLIGQLAEGEQPSAATSQTALLALNQMIDSWNLERLMVYSTQDQSFTWPANEITRTLGPTGNFVGQRPIALDQSTYYYQPGNQLSFPISFINEAQYNAILLKTNNTNYPAYIFVNETYPDITMKIYPKPTLDLVWHFISVVKIAEFTNLSDTVLLPPGYKRAFAYNLAVEIAAYFGVEPSPRVIRIADISKRNLKRINAPGDLLALPDALVSPTGWLTTYWQLPT